MRCETGRASPPNVSKQDAGLESAGEETRYLLDRWQIVASVRGTLSVRPLGSALHPEELAALLALLSGVCDEDFPRIVLIELGNAKIIGHQWTILLALIADFANRIGARCRLIAGNDRPVSAACLYRLDHI